MDARTSDDDSIDNVSADFRGLGGMPAGVSEGGDQKALSERLADVLQTGVHLPSARRHGCRRRPSAALTCCREPVGYATFALSSVPHPFKLTEHGE